MAEKKIGKKEFKVDKMPATEGTRNLLKLTKIVGPGIGKLSAVLSLKGEEQTDATLAAFSEIIGELDPNIMTAFIVELVETAQVKDGTEYMGVIYDMHIEDLSEAFELLFFVLKVNYASFFGAKMDAALTVARTRAASLSPTFSA